LHLPRLLYPSAGRLNVLVGRLWEVGLTQHIV
jgi:hypothetical protein